MITSSDQLFTSLPLPNDPRTINLVLSGDIMTVETISQYLTRIQTADRYPGLKVIICKPPGVYDIQSFMENSEFGAITFDNYEFTDISDEGLNLVSSNFVLIDNLTTGGSTNALSAQQGVVLKNLIDNITVPDSFE
jgi:hypothetical protein